MIAMQKIFMHLVALLALALVFLLYLKPDFVLQVGALAWSCL